MKENNKEALIKKHRKGKRLYRIRNGGSVIGQEVDENNRLVYVVKKEDGSIDVSYAEETKAIMHILPSEGYSQTKRVALVKQPEESVEGNPSKGDK